MHFSRETSQTPSHCCANAELLRPDTFQCQECADAFTAGMTPHLAVECPKKRHLCVVCGQQFAILLALSLHKTMHENPQSNGFIKVNGVRTNEETHGIQTLPSLPSLYNQPISTASHRPAFGRTDESTSELVVTLEGGKRGRRLSNRQRTRRPPAAQRGVRTLSAYANS